MYKKKNPKDELYKIESMLFNLKREIQEKKHFLVKLTFSLCSGSIICLELY